MTDTIDISAATQCGAPEPRRRWRVLILLAGLALPQILLYGQSLLGVKVLLPLDNLKLTATYLPVPLEWQPYYPSNMTLIDVAIVLEPWRRFAVSEVRAGRLPLWNPYIYCGAPFLAANQSALFSPFRVLDYLFPGTLIIAWTQLIKAIIAGVGVYLFLRRTLSVRFWAAAFGAWAFPLTGFMVQWQGYPISQVIAWLPWSMLAVYLTVRRPSGWGGPLLAATTLLLLVSGHAATAAQTMIGCGLYAVWLLVANHRGRLWSLGSLGAIVALAAGWGVGIVASAAQTLPTAEYMTQSARINSRLVGHLETPPLGWMALPQLVAPDYWGSERVNSRFLIANVNRLESAASGYAGLIATLLFAPLALAHPRWRRQAWFWLALALFAAGQTLNVPLLSQLYEQFPLNMLRNNRLVFLTGWSFVVLAVLGLDCLLTAPPRPRWQWTIPTAALVVLILLTVRFLFAPPTMVVEAEGSPVFGWFIRAWLGVIVLAIVALCLWWMLWGGVKLQTRHVVALGIIALAELLWNAIGINPQCDPALYYPKLGFIDAIQSRGPGRVCGYSCAAPDILMQWRLSDIRGYDGVDPKLYVELLDCFARQHPQESAPYAALFMLRPQASPVLDMLNLRYIVARGRPSDDRVPIYENHDEDYHVIECANCLPRAYVPTTTQVVADRDARLNALADPSFDPRAVALVEAPLKLPAPAQGSAEIVQETPNELTLRYSMQTKGLVVLSDCWDAGWRAWIDGRETTVLRVNHALRGVVAPAGEGKIVYRYEPASFYRGLRASAAGLGALVVWCAALALTCRGRGRTAPAAASSP
jgi:hypothetical protein